MRVFYKILSKTLIPIQIIGFTLALFVSISLLFVSISLHNDLSPIFGSQTNLFQENTIILSKKVSAFKSLNKNKIYFNQKEINNIKKQVFVKDIAFFKYAAYKVKAYSGDNIAIPGFQTDLFFESIPKEYLDINTSNWNWKIEDDFIPIIIPESYLKLYNFGFAESQNLPVLSKDVISEITFSIKIFGNNKSQDFKAKIIGFSNKINSILVPTDFLIWSNTKFAPKSKIKTNRIIVELNNKENDELLTFFNNNNYSINEADIENQKLKKMFKFLFIFIFIIAGLIFTLSLIFMFLSLSLMLQKNTETLKNINNIGYLKNQIINYYYFLMLICTILAFITAYIINIIVRFQYRKILIQFFEIQKDVSSLCIFVLTLLISLAIFYRVYLNRKLRHLQ